MLLHKRTIPEEFARPPSQKANKLGCICGTVHKKHENNPHDNVIKQGKDRKSGIMRLITSTHVCTCVLVKRFFYRKCLHCIEAKCLQLHRDIHIKIREKTLKALCAAHIKQPKNKTQMQNESQNKGIIYY